MKPIEQIRQGEEEKSDVTKEDYLKKPWEGLDRLRCRRLIGEVNIIEVIDRRGEDTGYQPKT